MRKQVDIGDRFGCLSIEAFEIKSDARQNHTFATVLCDCGNRRSVRLAYLVNGSKKSCGCLHRSRVKAAMTKHGYSYTKTYSVHEGMLARCYNVKHPSYSNYGGRGITVCDSWRSSFENFLKDMGDCPPEMQLDRIDNDKGYGPDNCRWVTRKENNSNKRTNRFITHNGETKTITQWAEQHGLTHDCLSKRLKYGWSMETVLSKPSERSKGT